MPTERRNNASAAAPTSAGAQYHNSPTLGEKPDVGEHAPDTPGFHAQAPEELERPAGPGVPTSPASLQLDADTRDRADTGTGDQPGNMGGSRTGTPPEPVRKS